MTLAKTRLAYLLVALAANLLVAGTSSIRSAYACSCAGIATPTEDFKASDAVFSGEVATLGIDDPNPQDDLPLGGVEFSVEKSWKGVSKGSVVIYGQGESYGTSVTNSCDVEFERGGSYLVYAYSSGENGPLGTDVCTATKPLARAEADLRALGPPAIQLPDTGGLVVSPLEGAASVAAVFALIALAIGARRANLRRWV